MKRFLSILGIIAVAASLIVTPTYAEEIDCARDPNHEECIMPLDDAVITNTEAPRPVDYVDTWDELNDSANVSNCIGGDPNTDCAEDAAEETDEEAEIQWWTVYLSLGALGAAVLIFITLNLCDRKRK